MEPINNKLEWVAVLHDKSKEAVEEKVREFTGIALSKINKITTESELIDIVTNTQNKLEKLDDNIISRTNNLNNYKKGNQTKVIGALFKKKVEQNSNKLTLLHAQREYYKNVLNTALLKFQQLKEPSLPPSSKISPSPNVAASSSQSISTTTQVEKASSEEPMGVEVGSAIVMRGSSPCPLSIYQWTDKNKCICFEAYIKGTTHKVGEVSLDWVRTVNNHPKFGTYFGGDFIVRISRGYGPNDASGNPPNQDLPKIYLSTINNLEGIKPEGDKSFKGIGTVLFQVAMEYSFERKCEGRIQLTAVENSHGFHYLQGMRTMGRSTPDECHKVDTQISEELEKVKKAKEKGENLTADTESLYVVEMYMSEEGIEMWKKKIAENPILFATQG